MNYNNQNYLNMENDLKNKEKELKNLTEMNNNLKNKIYLLFENNKKLKNNEGNLKQNILIIQNELNQKKEELETEKLNRQELISVNNNYINQINYLDKEKREKSNEINELKKYNKENEDKIKKAYEKFIEDKNNEIKILKQNERNNKIKEEKVKEEILKKNNFLNEENNSLKNELINLKKINEQQLEKKMMSIINLTKLNEEDEGLIYQLENKNKEYENLINQMKNKKDELEQNIKNNLEEKTKLINEHKEKEDKINNMNKIIEELQKKIKQLENDNNLKDQKIKELEKDKEELSEKLKQNSINNSKFPRKYDNLEIKHLDLIEETKNKKSVKNEFNADEKKCIIAKNKNINFAQYNNYFYNYKLNLSGSRDGKEPLKEYKAPTLVGLNDIGATCFMNSVLQCLSQTKGLTNYFLNEENEENIFNNNIALKNKNDLQLSPVYLELIKILWKKDGEKSFSPNVFMNTVNNMNPSFKIGQPGNAKDFFIFVLSQLHQELKKSVNKNKSQNLLTLNQYDENNTLNYSFNYFQKECSIISDIFFGFTETTNECLNCKNKYNSQGKNNSICYNYGIFNCLIFPLEKIKNMKNNSQNNNIQINNNRISLYECFVYNQKSNYFIGDNRIYCNICKQIFDSIYTSKIFSSSNVLVLILDREKGNIYDVKLDFYETIDITQFVQRRDSPKVIYNLYGVITHIDQSGQNAHFVASCKSPIDDKWYRYNDAIVNPITNLQKEVIEFEMPYILFYQKNNS